MITDIPKYARHVVIFQSYTPMIDGKFMTILHSITYVSDLFQGSQMDGLLFQKGLCNINECKDCLSTLKVLTSQLNYHLPFKKSLNKATINEEKYN